MSVCIVDNGGANLSSLQFAFNRLGFDCVLSAAQEDLHQASHIVLPGVGHASDSMQRLRAQSLDEALRNTSKPVLGICLGMQIMYESSAEGDTECLGVFTGSVNKMKASQRHPVPHMGWNQIEFKGDHPLFEGVASNSYFYFVHGYAALPGPDTFATSSYGDDLAVVVIRENFIGVQFHPEKSGMLGAKLLSNFVRLV